MSYPTHAGPASPRLRMTALGTVAVMCQALLLREAMTTLGGSEIAWGLLFFLWLSGAAGGARIGGIVTGVPGLDRWTPLAVAATTILGAAILRAAPWFLVDVGGEVAGGPQTILVWLIAVVPPSAAVGFGFSRLAGLIGSAARSYALESAGAALGGLIFTFAVAPFGTSVIAGAVLGIGFAAGLSPDRKSAALTAFGLSCVAGFASGPLIEDATWAAGRRPYELAVAKETRHQRIEISAGPEAAVYLDGRLAGNLPVDPYLVLPKSRVLPLLHPHPARIVAVGGLTDGRVAGLLDEYVQQLTIIEEDRELAMVLRSLPNLQIDRVLSDPRVDLTFKDPLPTLRGLSDLDLVVLFDGPPSTLRANRSRTTEFFKMCRSRLAPGGLVIVDGGTDGTYLGGAAGRLLGIQFTTLGAVFPNIAAIAGNPVYFVGGTSSADMDFDPDALKQRWRDRSRVPGDSLGPMLETLLQPGLSTRLTSDLESSGDYSANSIARPGLMLPAAALSESRAYHPLLRSLVVFTEEMRWIGATALVFAVAWILLAQTVGPTKRVRTTPAVVLGFSSMTWWLVLMAAWQNGRGSVYSEIGLLSALFMAGMAIGAAAATVMPAAFGTARLFAGGALLSAVIAAGFSTRMLVTCCPVLLLVAGAITGAAFSGVAGLAGGNTSRNGIARAFSGDEIGAAAAALVVGVVGMPWLGTTIISSFTAVCCLAVIPSAIRSPSS